MKIKKAIEILELHNKWRRDDEGKYEMAEPKELGIAIDTIVNQFKNDVTMRFESEEDLKQHITMNMPIAIEPTKEAKTMLINPYTSNNAREIIEESIVQCLLK